MITQEFQASYPIFIDSWQKREYDAVLEDWSPDLNDTKRTRLLVGKMDVYILPICAWIYPLNYLDRDNIGNTKVLNEETGNSLPQRTGMNNVKYAVVVSLFWLAYAIFKVPSNLIMKSYVRTVYLITFWYPVGERSVRIAFILASAAESHTA
ncbi:hypothetical protein SLS54_008932 [Diplodia seriata]